MAAKGVRSIDEYLVVLDASTRATVDRLRTTIRAAHADLVEEIKWNAPSFSLDGEDRVTLGVERRGGVRIVLHRGAKPKDASTFRFDDPEGLARWPAPDRGVIVVADEAEARESAAALGALVARWIDATVER